MMRFWTKTMWGSLGVLLATLPLGVGATTLAAVVEDATTCTQVLQKAGQNGAYTRELVTAQKEGEVFESGINLPLLRDRVISPGTNGEITLVVCNNGETDGVLTGSITGKTGGDVADPKDPFYTDLKVGEKPFTDTLDNPDTPEVEKVTVFDKVPIKRGEALTVKFPYSFPFEAVSGNSAGSSEYAPGVREASLGVSVLLAQAPNAVIPATPPDVKIVKTYDRFDKATGEDWWKITVENVGGLPVKNLRIVDSVDAARWGTPPEGTSIDKGSNKWLIPVLVKGRPLQIEVSTKGLDANKAYGELGEGRVLPADCEGDKACAGAVKPAPVSPVPEGVKLVKTYDRFDKATGEDWWKITVENVGGKTVEGLRVADSVEGARWGAAPEGTSIDKGSNKWLIPVLGKGKVLEIGVSTKGVKENKAYGEIGEGRVLPTDCEGDGACVAAVKPGPKPTEKPTEKPTVEPTPTDKPTTKPTPTEKPTTKPTPSEKPTEKPKPTETPKPTAKSTPTEKPAEKPKPTESPKPTTKPTETTKPSEKPTPKPTTKPAQTTTSPNPAPPAATNNQPAQTTTSNQNNTDTPPVSDSSNTPITGDSPTPTLGGEKSPFLAGVPTIAAPPPTPLSTTGTNLTIAIWAVAFTAAGTALLSYLQLRKHHKNHR